MRKQTSVEKLVATNPSLWEMFRQDLGAAIQSFLSKRPKLNEEGVVEMEERQAGCLHNVINHGAALPDFTSVVALTNGVQFEGGIVFHEGPFHKYNNGKCCIHLGVLCTDAGPLDLWCCPKQEVYIIVTDTDQFGVRIDHVNKVNHSLAGFAFRIADRLVTKRPELLAQPGERGYLN